MSPTPYHDIRGTQPAGVPPPPDASENYLRQPQPWALQQVQLSHNQALYSHGEYALFLKMWHIDDLLAGEVTRCSVCYLPYGDIADVYKQPAQNKCATCYGTTFEGGIKAAYVRPSVWDLNTPEEREAARGEFIRNTASVQTTPDCQIRVGDYAFRADNTRWQMRQPSTNLLRTGFEHASHEINAVGFSYGQFDREDENTVAYIMPPTPVALLALLGRDGSEMYPRDFSAEELALMSGA